MVNVETNVEYNVSSLSSWITAEKVYGGVLITVDSNSSLSERSATVVVYNEKYNIKVEISVTQRARPYEIGDVIYKSGVAGVVFQTSGYSGKLISSKSANDYLYWGEADKWCRNYGTGWRLPTKDELLDVHYQKSKFSKSLIDGAPYWTSTKTNEGRYYVVYLETGTCQEWGKDTTGHNVVAVCSF